MSAHFVNKSHFCKYWSSDIWWMNSGYFCAFMYNCDRSWIFFWLVILTSCSISTPFTHFSTHFSSVDAYIFIFLLYIAMSSLVWLCAILAYKWQIKCIMNCKHYVSFTKHSLHFGDQIFVQFLFDAQLFQFTFQFHNIGVRIIPNAFILFGNFSCFSLKFAIAEVIVRLDHVISSVQMEIFN